MAARTLADTADVERRLALAFVAVLATVSPASARAQDTLVQPVPSSMHLGLEADDGVLLVSSWDGDPATQTVRHLLHGRELPALPANADIGTDERGRQAAFFVGCRGTGPERRCRAYQRRLAATEARRVGALGTRVHSVAGWNGAFLYTRTDKLGVFYRSRSGRVRLVTRRPAAGLDLEGRHGTLSIREDDTSSYAITISRTRISKLLLDVESGWAYDCKCTETIRFVSEAAIHMGHAYWSAMTAPGHLGPYGFRARTVAYRRSLKEPYRVEEAALEHQSAYVGAVGSSLLYTFAWPYRPDPLRGEPPDDAQTGLYLVARPRWITSALARSG